MVVARPADKDGDTPVRKMICDARVTVQFRAGHQTGESFFAATRQCLVRTAANGNICMVGARPADKDGDAPGWTMIWDEVARM
ncbi:MAG: hypothetical protein ACRD52_17535 [Candidatus Acidiferrales bacterium]